MRLLALLAVLVWPSAPPPGAQDGPHAFVGARVIPVAGPEIPDGVVVTRGGKIVAVGPAGSTPVPADAVRHDLAGKVVMPGLGMSQGLLNLVE